MDKKTEETFSLLTQAGVTIGSQVMDNGEARHRMMTDGGKQGYILTETKLGGWQNAHSHGGNREFYAVASGWMAFADIHEGKYRVRIFTPDDDEVCSKPGVPHNVYLPPHGAIHTVKWGTAVGNPEKNGADWFPAPDEFDAWCKTLSEDAIRLAAA